MGSASHYMQTTNPNISKNQKVDGGEEVSMSVEDKASLAIFVKAQLTLGLILSVALG